MTLLVSGNLEAKDKSVWVKLHSIKAITTVHSTTPELATESLPFKIKRRQRRGRAETLVQVSLEVYVAQVLAAEIPANFPLEALKAQAVAIRTLASREETPHHREAFDFCDSTHCQLFSYRRSLPGAITTAVAQTRGHVLFQNNQAIHALYHSTCGGHTSGNGVVFGGEPLSYLAGSDDEKFCSSSPHWNWQAQIDLKELEATFPEVSQLRGLRVVDQDAGGRVLTLELLGLPSKKISAQDFLLKVGQRMGWSTLKSANFSVTQKGHELWFQGKGLGHGVGLCQWGAKGMAEAGQNYQQILRHYFPGTGIRRI